MSSNDGALFRVNPSTGAQTLLSDFGVGTPAGALLRGVAVVPEQPTPTPTPTPKPVGGVVVPTSKLEIAAPFAALAGLIIAVSAVVVVKRRRD